MNQPASKEPTMDEILSSIRQIIADDDESAAQKVPVAAKAAEVRPSPVIDPFSDDDEDEVPTLALSPEQIVETDDAASDDEEMQEPEPEIPESFQEEAPAEMVVPDDVAFALDEEPAPPPPAPKAPKPTASFAQAAPMPDPDLSADLTEELLEPATSAAVASTFAKLQTPRLSPNIPLSAGGVTVEGMIREMLRPMLKEWLEENLPSMVERIVAQEVERVSRGG
ncbi:DUF2497 domain-containing protein [Pelagibacterium limicola]|uniref:DUF2497 domain-containing protein n=1 Tax=Pelagibacterium limicola TaxID=2791022 RepID=UPI0018AFE05D|nr:DUF2497 domain-containing protein [Pelagibacterium limicola]